MNIDRSRHNVYKTNKDWSQEVSSSQDVTSGGGSTSTSGGGGSTIIITGGGGTGLTDEQLEKLNSIEKGAQVNQNAYSTLRFYKGVEPVTLTAISKTDTANIHIADPLQVDPVQGGAVLSLDSAALGQTIDLSTNSIIQTILSNISEIYGKLFWQLDEDGNIYTTLNAYSQKELSAWGLGPGEEPTGAQYLSELKDVDVSGLTNQGILQYNSSTGKWEVTDGSSIRPDLTGYATETWVNNTLTSYATKSYVTTEISNLVDSAPETLDTLYELAAALGNDPNFSTTVLNLIGTNTSNITINSNKISDNTAAITVNTNTINSLINRFDDLFEKVNIGTSSDPVYAIKAKYHLISVGEVVAYANTDVDVPTIFQALPIDPNTLKWQDGLLTVIGGGSGGGSVNGIVLNGSTYSPDEATKLITLPDYPTTLPASDVYPWAKAANKPSYTFDELLSKPTTVAGYGITDAVTLSGDQTINGVKTFASILKLTGNVYLDLVSIPRDKSAISFNNAGANRIGMNFTDRDGFIRIAKADINGDWQSGDVDLVLGSNKYKVLHAGNYNSYAPTLTGGGASGNWDINVTGYSNGLSIAGYGSNSLTYFQTNEAFAGLDATWRHYIICNHGNGETYFNRIIALDFFNDRISTSKMENGGRGSWKGLMFVEEDAAVTVNNVIKAYRYKISNSLPAITFDKPGSYAAGIGADGTKSRIRFGAVQDMDGDAWVDWSGNTWYFDGSVNTTVNFAVINSSNEYFSSYVSINNAITGTDPDHEWTLYHSKSGVSRGLSLWSYDANGTVYNEVATISSYGGNKLTVNGLIESTHRIVVGYDSGVNGSINCSNYFRSPLGLYLEGTYFTRNSGYAEIISGGNEIVISGGSEFYVNYRTGGDPNKATPTTWIWCAGSGSSRASFNLGSLTANGNIVATGEVTAYSDVRLKTDIHTLQYKGRLSPKTYIKDGKRSIGFIAQEVQALYPELVIEDNDENHYLSLNYGCITAVLSAQLNDVEDEVSKLKKRIKLLENKVKKYEQSLFSTYDKQRTTRVDILTTITD